MEQITSQKFVSNLSVFNTYSKGWRLFTSHFWVFLGAILLTIVAEILLRIITAVSSVIGETYSELQAIVFPLLIGTALGYLVVAPIQLGINWIFLKAAREEYFTFDNIFDGFRRNYWNIVIASALVTVMTLIGFILFVIPGIIIALRLLFVGYLVIDKQLNFIDAIKTSWHMTRGLHWTIIGIWLLSILIVIGGTLLFVVGIFPAVLWITASMTVLYHSTLMRQPHPVEQEVV